MMELKGYQNGLAMLDLEDLKTRRENLWLEFAKECVLMPGQRYY